MKAFLRTMAQVRHVAEADRLDAVLQQAGPALLIMDLRAKECRDLIDQVQKEWPEILIIALGIVNSDPLREAEQFGIYAAEDLELDRRRFQTLVGRAFDYLKVLQENRELRETSTSLSTLEPIPRAGAMSAAAGGGPSLRLLRFPRVFRQFDNVDALLTSIVESVADAAGVTRVGIFSKIRQGDRYRLRAGLRCLPETHEMEFGERDALVRWFNPTAEQILGLSSKDVLNKPAESVGSRLAAFLRETLESKSSVPVQRWIDNNTRRSLSVETRRLGDQHTPLGAVAVVHDLTAEETLHEKQALVDRAAFWTDLAASMSHEIRNPLVAIKTFAQLLPERFDDADFRKDFNDIVVKEIDRLDKIITQINNFAHPPELVFKPIDVRAPVKKAIEIARP